MPRHSIFSLWDQGTGSENITAKDVSAWEKIQQEYEQKRFEYAEEQDQIQALHSVVPLAREVVEHKLLQLQQQNEWLTMIRARQMLENASVQAENVPTSTTEDPDFPAELVLGFCY